MDFTPDILRAAYEFLEKTPPFSKWNLPDADDVKFVAAKSRAYAGRCTMFAPADDPKFCIDISIRKQKHTVSLMATMAHEMIHVHMGHACFKGKNHHDEAFWALAKQVCDEHGFDIGTF